LLLELEDNRTIFSDQKYLFLTGNNLKNIESNT
jgi:hypothetical protein